MDDRNRFKLLHGPYQAPRCRLGRKLFCEIRGWVPVQRFSAGRIAWPQTLWKRSPAFILTGDLANAVRVESNQAVCYWWGVTPQTVTVWRKALDLPRATEGTSRLHREWFPENIPPAKLKQGRRNANAPAANAKKGTHTRGNPRERIG